MALGQLGCPVGKTNIKLDLHQLNILHQTIYCTKINSRWIKWIKIKIIKALEKIMT